MDKYRNGYKKSMDELCGNNLSLSAEDIIEAYDKRESKPRKVTPLVSRYIGVAAACILTVGVVGMAAGAAGYGPLAGIFSSKSDAESDDPDQARVDRISAGLVAEGYMYKTEETQSVGIYDVTFEGITGDWTNAQLLFTIHVNDEEFAREHDRLFMTVYRGFDADTYAKRIDTAGVFDDKFYENISEYILFDTATAYRLREDSQDYALTFGAYEYYMAPGATIFTEIRSIRESESSLIEPEDGETMLNCTFEFTLPDDINALAEIYRIKCAYNGSPVFVGKNNVEYHVTEVTFGAYGTELLCEFFYRGTDIEYVDNDFDANYGVVENSHRTTAQDIRLVVDGYEYSPIDLGGVYNDPSGLRRGMVTFPAIGYNEAASVVLTYKGMEVAVLK